MAAIMSVSFKVDIDFKEVINDLGNLQTYILYEGDDEKYVSLDDVVDVLKHHIKAKQKKDSEPLINLSECWIPITDALPKDGIDVLLSYDSHLTDGRIIHQVCIAYYDGENKDWLSVEESPEIISYPKAWMLLPDAFEESEEQAC